MRRGKTDIQNDFSIADGAKIDSIDSTLNPSNTSIPTGQAVKTVTDANTASINTASAKIDKNQDNISLNAFRTAINGSLSLFGMVDGKIDEYQDEDGIDNPSSSNISYDAGNNLYSPNKDSLTTSPFAHLKMNEISGTNIVDTGTGANTFTSLNNASTMTVAGQGGELNTALDFNGTTDRIDMSALRTDIISDTIGSIAFWFKTLDASGNFFTFTNTVVSNEHYFGIFLTGGQVNIRIENDNPSVVHLRYSFSGASLNDDNWHHVVITQDNTQLRIYLDGVENSPTKTTDTTPGAWINTLTNADAGTIGALKNTSGGFETFYEGELDDLRYYQNKALTADEVVILYNSGSGTEDDQPEGIPDNMTLQ